MNHKIGRVDHLNSAMVFWHEFGDLFECLFVFRNIEPRKDKDLVGLQPVDIGPIVLVRLLYIVFKFLHMIEMREKNTFESICNIRGKL